MSYKFVAYGLTLFGMLGMFMATNQSILADTVEHTITKAQPELMKESLVITTKDHVKHVFSVEVAKTAKEQEIGEMFRTAIPENGGMLFLWPAPQQSTMWMKNTLVPLDMVFINADHHIQAIAENTVPYSLAPIGSQGPVTATLELKGGITQQLGIKVGDYVESKAFENASTAVPVIQKNKINSKTTK